MRNNSPGSAEHPLGRLLTPAVAALALVLAGAAGAAPAGEDPAGGDARGAPEKTAAGNGESGPAGRGDINARRRLDNGKELLTAHEYERGVKMLEGILESFPDDPIRFQVYLTLGRHLCRERQFPEALGYLTRLNTLEKPDEPLSGETRELFLEGLYLTGVANFEQHQYERTFPVLRRITANYPHSAWANQAYYYIGMSHFALGNWNKAIEALSLVGTAVDPNSPAIEYAEASRRFYVKISDGDLPVLHRLGKEVTVAVETTHGDREKVVCVPLSSKADVFIGSLATEVGVAKPGDGTLQVTSGDVITTTYLDDNTQSGEKDVPRVATVKVVSSGVLGFTTGTFESPAPAAFCGSPLFLSVFDADLDVSPEADAVSVKVQARYRDEELGAETAPDVTQPKSEEEKWKVRDEVTVRLTELGAAGVSPAGEKSAGETSAAPPGAVRTGRFGGSVKIEPVVEGQPVRSGEGVLHCAVGDEITASYVDQLHIGGAKPREIKARIGVAGELENRPRTELYVVTDPVIRAKKNTVEATAFLELARIFKSMGLNDGAGIKAGEGLALDEVTVRATDKIPNALRERAFELKWELELAKDDYAGALATCELFSRLFPSSPLADQALLGMGRARMEAKQYREATQIFQKILSLPQSQAKAEAQFRIAEATEGSAEAAQASRRDGAAPGASNAAIPQYRLCADRYPASEFAGPALAKVVDYYIRSKDFAQAQDLLEQIFNDHPDAKFLDSMLLKWSIVAFRREDFSMAQQKLTQLIFEYPESKFAEEARKLLPQIEARLKK